jgi:hypothetical protein
MMDSAPRTVILTTAGHVIHCSSHRRVTLQFHNSTVSKRLTVWGVRTLPRLMLLSSRHRIWLPFRSSTCGHVKISSNPLWSFVSSGTSSLVCPDKYSGLNQWVGWGKSGIITEMRPGLLVSDRDSLPLVSVLIYLPRWSYCSRFVVVGSFILTH